MHVPAWLRATSPENRLPVAVAIAVAITLQLRLPDRYGLHPRWLVPGLEVVLLVILSALNPVRLNRSSRLGRLASIGVVAAITLDNGVSALPFSRASGTRPYPDFLFPQMTDPHLASPDWEPLFIDYLYVSLTNVFAFSPTDTMPLSRWAKALMASQSVVALSTTALVIARAVNILK